MTADAVDPAATGDGRMHGGIVRYRREKVQVVLQDVLDRHGEITADLVLSEATDPSNPLHNEFNWDDAEAAHQHRLDQARALIRSVKIVYRDADENERVTRGFMHVRRGNGPGHYVPTVDSVQDPITRKIILRDMERDWKRFKDRYEGYDEFAVMIMAHVRNGEEI